MEIIDTLAELITNLFPASIQAQIPTAIALTLLAIYGDNINRYAMSFVKGKNLAIRTIAFILLCSVGYGFLTIFCLENLEVLLNSFGHRYFGPITILIFICLGVLGSRKNQI